MKSFQCMLGITLISVTLCLVTEENDKEKATCDGSLVITNTDGVETKFSSLELEVGKVKNIPKVKSSKISSVRVEGCGCFYIYSRPRGRGASELIISGEKRSADYLRFSKAKSVERISCETEKNAMPVWGVVLTVLVLVALVAILAVIVIRVRKYKEVSQDPS